MSNQWVDENTRRQLFIDILYEAYGRNNPEHPQHGTYSGLWEQFLYEEAGVFARDQYFNREMMKAKAIQDLELPNISNEQIESPFSDVGR